MIDRKSLLFLAVSCVSCDHYAHGIHHGTLADVAQPSLQIYVNEEQYVLSIGNEGNDRACLVLDGLSAKVDGVAQTQTRDGGRSTGRHKGDFGPIDKTDFCESADFAIARSNDTTKKSNVVEVTDGATTLKMEIPNVLVQPVWSKPPPATAKPGDTFRVQIAPPPLHGASPNDAIYASASDPKSLVNATLITHVNADTSIDIDIPKTLAAGSYTIIVASAEHSIPAISCGAAFCSVASEFTLTAPIAIAP